MVRFRGQVLVTISKGGYFAEAFAQRGIRYHKMSSRYATSKFRKHIDLCYQTT